MFKVLMYKDRKGLDGLGKEVKSFKGSVASNVVRACGIATTSASTHGGRIDAWFFESPFEGSEAVAYSGELGIAEYPDAQYRIFRV